MNKFRKKDDEHEKVGEQNGWHISSFIMIFLLKKVSMCVCVCVCEF